MGRVDRKEGGDREGETGRGNLEGANGEGEMGRGAIGAGRRWQWGVGQREEMERGGGDGKGATAREERGKRW